MALGVFDDPQTVVGGLDRNGRHAVFVYRERESGQSGCAVGIRMSCDIKILQHMNGRSLRALNPDKRLGTPTGSHNQSTAKITAALNDERTAGGPSRDAHATAHVGIDTI